MSSRMPRVQRSAKALSGGQKILDYLLKDSSKRLLLAAADEGVPPVSRISGALKTFATRENIDIDAVSVRQFVGTAVRAILEDEGYAITERGIRLPRDPVFSSGSVYEKRSETSPHKGALLDRILGSLSADEAERALGILKSRLQKS